MNIRLETTADFREVENLTREAFWNVYRPGFFNHLDSLVGILFHSGQVFFLDAVLRELRELFLHAACK